jgi:hypothetical protein
MLHFARAKKIAKAAPVFFKMVQENDEDECFKLRVALLLGSSRSSIAKTFGLASPISQVCSSASPLTTCLARSFSQRRP